jgi:hypothetical protein
VAVEIRRAVMKKHAVLVSALLGTLLLAIPVQSQAFFCGFGGGFSFGVGGWGYPYYAGYHPGYWGYGRYPYHGYRGYPYYAYRPFGLYSYPVVTTLPTVSEPEVAEK